jgi:high-affinity iron transporter
MFGALVIVFREVIEAGLIIGIVLAATRGISGRGHWVAAGVLLGTLGAGIVALFAEAIANAFEGSGQELLNASVLGAAVVMLMWHTVWMARHGREMAAEMAAVGAAVTAGKRPMDLPCCARARKSCYSSTASSPAARRGPRFSSAARSGSRPARRSPR